MVVLFAFSATPFRHASASRFGRWTQKDPQPSANPYLYANDNPVNAVDPSGRSSLDCAFYYAIQAAIDLTYAGAVIGVVVALLTINPIGIALLAVLGIALLTLGAAIPLDVAEYQEQVACFGINGSSS